MWTAIISLGTAIVKLLSMLGIYHAGKKSMEADQAKAEAKAREKQAQVAADISGLNDDDLNDRMRDGF
jgi:hypothetical protein